MLFKQTGGQIVCCFFSSCVKDDTDHAAAERFTNNNLLREDELSFTNVSKSLAVQFSTPTVAREHCSPSPPSVHSTTLQERMDLEMSVLRRQEAVLKLQEEYYTLKIKLMKKQMEEPVHKEWCNSRLSRFACLWNVTDINNNNK